MKKTRPSTDFNNIQQWLLPILKQQGLSVEDLAKRVGVTSATIRRYLTDKSRPSLYTMSQICWVLGKETSEGTSKYIPRKGYW